MTDSNSPHIGGDVNITGGDFVGRDKITNIYPPGSSPAELTPEERAEIETRYRAQVAERYNRLGFAGLGIGDTRLSDVALDDVFVRLTLTVERIVREPIPPEQWEREEPPSLTLPPLWGKGTRRRSGRSTDSPSLEGGGRQGEGSRQRERVVITQEPITLGDALTQHALIVGEPGAGKSTLLRWLAVTFAAGRQREAKRLGSQADADRLPLLVELGRLPQQYLSADSRETPNWKVFLPDYLTKQPPFDDIPAALLEQALAAGRCLLLGDGLDEIADLAARRRLADSLAEYARSSQNRLVLSSRPAGVSGSEGALGPRFQRLTIQRFEPKDVRRFFGFLYALDSELTPTERANEADALFRSVESAPKTLELATTPLLATLLFLIWRRSEGNLPERRVELYALCCRMLIESWEAQHDVAYTGVLGDIGWERHLRLLAPLAYAIHNGGQRTDAPARELIPVLAQAMQEEGLAAPASATLEAEKFLRTLSLRSGLLQFLGADRYGFPHLTFQEYLTARHIAAQPDPDYIDLVMVDLHKAWWREVHLLVIGHLGSGSAGAEKASRLLLQILDVYPLPWGPLRAVRFNPWPPDWLVRIGRIYDSHRILKWPVSGIAYAIALPPALPGLTRKWLALRLEWQWERRLAWVLAREYVFASNGFYDCFPLGVDSRFLQSLNASAHGILLQIIRDPILFDDGDSSWRIQAGTAGSRMQLSQVSEAVVSALVDALVEADNPFRIVRARITRSLAQLGQVSEEASLALVVALGNSDWQVRVVAARGLGELGEASEGVVSALVAALDDSSDPLGSVQAGAARSLGKLGHASEKVVSALVAVLGDSNGRVRAEAAWSLGELGQVSGEVVSALVAALDDSERQVREEAARSLGKLGQASEKVVSALVRVLDDSSDPLGIGSVRAGAAWSLGELGQASKVVASEEVVSTLVVALNDSDWQVREEAARSLGKLGQVSEKVLSALVKALSDSDDLVGARVRAGAAWGLGELGQASGEVASALVAALDDSDWQVREEAARSLGKLGHASEKVMSALVTALGDWPVREEAARSLRKLAQRSGEVVFALVRALRDSEHLLEARVRAGAAWSLGELGETSGEVVSALMAALDDSSLTVRVTVAGSLVYLGQASEKVVSTLVAALNDSDDLFGLVRAESALILMQLGQESEEVISTLVTALDGSSRIQWNVSVRCLGQLEIKDEAQLRRVLIALNRRLHDRDDDVRRAALTAIRRLLDGRQIPGYRWVPIRERRERARRRRIFWYWVLGISLAVLVAWVAAGLTTYLSLDEFWVRFVGALAALVALAAGAVQVLGWFRRPPWDR